MINQGVLTTLTRVYQLCIIGQIIFPFGAANPNRDFVTQLKPLLSTFPLIYRCALLRKEVKGTRTV